MQLALMGGVAAAVVVGLTGGWVLGAPSGVNTRIEFNNGLLSLISTSPLRPNKNLATFSQVTSGQPSLTATGDDKASGWQARQALRDTQMATLNRLEQLPCDEKARTDFLSAWIATEDASMRDAVNSSDPRGAAFWRTDADEALTARIEQLIGVGDLTHDEMNHAMMVHKVGENNYPLEEAPVLSRTCGHRRVSSDELHLNQARFFEQSAQAASQQRRGER